MTQYLDFHLTAPALATVHDKQESAPKGANAVVPVRFKDGNVGLLPPAQISAINDIIEYNWQDELMDWNQQCTDGWIDEPVPTEAELDEGGEGLHIIHHIAALRFDRLGEPEMGTALQEAFGMIPDEDDAIAAETEANVFEGHRVTKDSDKVIIALDRLSAQRLARALRALDQSPVDPDICSLLHDVGYDIGACLGMTSDSDDNDPIDEELSDGDDIHMQVFPVTGTDNDQGFACENTFSQPEGEPAQ